MGSPFIGAVERAVAEKNSVLCVGLDPKPASADAMLEFCLRVIEQTAPHAAAFKPNAQFLLPFSRAHHQRLANAIRGAGSVSVFDAKLGDIGSTNDAALHWIADFGYQSATASPFAGNVHELVTQARGRNTGLFFLALMSNPGAAHFMRASTVGGQRGFEWIAEQVKAAGGDGVVVGATNDAGEAKRVREIVGKECVFLVPGVGAQGGEASAILRLGGNALVNVGRAVLFAQDAAGAAKTYQARFNEARRR